MRRTTVCSETGSRLRKLRVEKGLSLRELSKQTGIDPSYLCYLEKGNRNLNKKLILALTAFYGVTADYLLGSGPENEIHVEELSQSEGDIDADVENMFRKSGTGYVLVYMPESGMANKNGWVLLHRIVMAKSIGRDLRPEEVVHHIDGDKTNNDLSNLMLFPNNAEHQRYHAKQKRDQKIDELLKK